MPLRIGYAEEQDSEFIRWTTNLLDRFIRDGKVALVGRQDKPDALLASIWPKQAFPENIPVILVSNENWQFWKPHEPLSFYKAVIGLYPPDEPCAFIPYWYGAVHYDVPVARLYRLREELLDTPKSRFCCFVSSNGCGGLAEARIALVQAIGQWRPVDCGGAVLNNLGYRAPRGLDFLRWIARYRYMVCLENFRAPHYITEKPFQAWFAGTVPIYDGGALGLLNPDAIIDASAGDVVEQLQRLEDNPAAYDARRRADLCEPISLAAFEDGFQKLVLDAF